MYLLLLLYYHILCINDIIVAKGTAMKIETIRKFVKDKLISERSGHDYLHIERVEHNALKLMQAYPLETSEKEVIIAACLVHDLIDYKVTKDIEKEQDEVISLLENSKANSEQIEEIIYIINNISYSKNLEEKKTLNLNGQIVQDADRLDAIGAVGIARTFYYGGSKGNPFYDENTARSMDELTENAYKNKSSSVINHFYEKLLLLKDQMNTDVAKKEAKSRHDFMVKFLEKFDRER